MNEVLLKYWVLTTGLLAAKMWANSIVQVYVRFTQKQFVNEEDAHEFGKLLKADIKPSTIEHPLVERAALCWRNDLENIPLFLILALGYVLIGGTTWLGVTVFSLYVVSRGLHTLFYLLRMQPWRTIAYECGSAATVVLLAHSLWLAFG